MSHDGNIKRGILRSLNSLLWVKRGVNRLQWLVYTKVWGMDICVTTVISRSAKLDRTYPAGIHIGSYCCIAFEAVILTHDMCRNVRTHTYIGDNCFIGAKSIILPGVRVGDGSIVAAGAVVTKDVPPGTIVAGNPAQVIRTGITVGHFGILKSNEPETMAARLGGPVVIGSLVAAADGEPALSGVGPAISGGSRECAALGAGPSAPT